VAKVLVEWDDTDAPEGNVRHVARHGITPEEVRQVLNDPRSTSGWSRSSGLPITFGRTKTGRYIPVTYRIVGFNPTKVKPVTAYPVQSPGGRP
jgi:hypothetical protein